jgi:guanylate kinase
MLKSINYSKPVILAICGKSATGKDSLAKWLYKDLKDKYFCNLIVSDTTRPIRQNEKNLYDYNFISEEKFKMKILDEEYLEYSEFRGWYYGTPKDEIHQGINIGVFNAQGMENLLAYRRKYIIVPIYLETTNPIIRLRRSHDRENKWKFQYFRRLFSDWKNFFHIFDILEKFKVAVILVNYPGVVKESEEIYKHLRYLGVL